MKFWLIGWAEYVLTEIAFRIWDCGEADDEKFNERSLNYRVGNLFYRASQLATYHLELLARRRDHG